MGLRISSRYNHILLTLVFFENTPSWRQSLTHGFVTLFMMPQLVLAHIKAMLLLRTPPWRAILRALSVLLIHGIFAPIAALFGLFHVEVLYGDCV